jgi:hypothetical protein
MEPGFVLDETRNQHAVATWIEGAPESSFWMGIKLRGKQRLPVTTYRCRRCGYLESYA